MESGGWCHVDLRRMGGSLTQVIFSTHSHDWLPHSPSFLTKPYFSESQLGSIKLLPSRFCPGVQWSELEGLESIPYPVIARRVPTSWVNQAYKGTNSELLLRVHGHTVIIHDSVSALRALSALDTNFHARLPSIGFSSPYLSFIQPAIRIYYCFNHVFLIFFLN